jgi:type 1 glutamine amidotransferase
MKKAALPVGGWEGYKPLVFRDVAVGLLEAEGFEVARYKAPAPLAEPDGLADLDLIVPILSSARSSHQPEFGNMTEAEEDGMLQLAPNGCGFAGLHGHMGDAFRDRPTYHFLIGGQFAGRPPGWLDNPVPADDFIDNEVTITNTFAGSASRWKGTTGGCLASAWAYRREREHLVLIPD